MIIYTNEGNPLGLKLLLCAKFGNRDVEIKKVVLNDPAISTLRHLPILELKTGIQIFSSDAAANYLFPCSENLQLRDQWMEWSTAQLAPALTQNMAVGHRVDQNAKTHLNLMAKRLDDTLKKSDFILGAKLSAVDLAVWSLLAPDGTLKGAQDIDNLLRWYRHIASLPEVKECLTKLPVKDLHFTSLQQSNSFGGLHHIVLNLAANSEDLHLLADSPNQLTETLTAEEQKLAAESFIYVESKEIKEPRTVLPKPGEKNILISSALPYVNNVPHLGNIIGCVLSADVFARFSRLCGYNTLYICGTDEYGTATETKALSENLTPKQICDKYFELHNSIYRWFEIGFDYFGRTTTQEQTEIVQSIFNRLLQKDYLNVEAVEQLLCTKCDRYLADRFVEGTCPHPGCGYEDARGDQCDKCGKLVNATELIRPRCKVCNTAPVVRLSDQFFFNLPKIEPDLRTWLDQVDQNWTHNARVITKSWIREGLKPRCITRDLKWGIPVPHKGFENKVFYVWFDAPIGYISITRKYSSEWQQWWQPKDGTKVDYYQFMAKDNVPFHAVMFPATLLAANDNWNLVSHIMATEYLNYEGGKFSKSRGIGVFGNDAQDTGIPADIWRFYLLSARPEGQDSSFSWNDLAARNNSELLNNLGNFVNRALVFCEKNYDSTIPKMDLNQESINLLSLVNRELKGYVLSMEKAKYRDGIRHLLSISRNGNQFMQSTKPWVLLKGSDEEKLRAGSIIGICCNLACQLATLLVPFMPETARNLFKQLNVERKPLNVDKPQMTMLLKPNHKIGKPAPLFAKIEQNVIDELKAKYGGPQEANGSPNKSAGESIEELTKAVNAQGEKVRALKSSGAAKTVWQPEVTILLDLKAKLAKVGTVQTKKDDAPVPTPKPNNNQSVKELEDKITAQGNKVRQLKASGDKSVWQPEVNILLDLKKQLTAAQSAAKAIAPVTSNSSDSKPADPKLVKDLETKISAQGEKVRKLKSSSDKSVWQPEVEVLLNLKKQLMELTGANSTIAATTGKTKKK